jgi:hypothetical protein
MGFTDRMGDVLAASDALIHSSAGLTVLEAIIRGCPVISYGFGYGHVRASNRALERFGLAQVVRSAADLEPALARALAHHPEPDPSFARRPPTASLILSDERRSEPLPAWRMRVIRGALTGGATLAIAAWTLTTGASYSLVSHIAHIKPVTAVTITRPEVGVLVEAPAAQVPALANELAGQGIRASFALSHPPTAADYPIFTDGDQAIPRLGDGGLVRWLETGDQLRHLRRLGFRPHHFVYASNGPSLGQWWLARTAGGHLVAGAVLLDDRDDRAPLRSGQVVELRISSPAQAASLLAKLSRELRTNHLRGVPVGRLMHDAGVRV